MKRLVLIALLGACSGSDPVDAEGTYTVGITNREDPCMFGWTVGQMSSGVEVVITQNGDAALAEVKGLAGGYLSFALGSSTFSGDVSGNDLNLFVTGTKPQTKGNCTYTYDGHIDATLTGDALQGTLSYVANTNTASDCAAVACTSKQDFSGARPPR